MQTIWKYPLEVTDEQDLKMPRGARLLHVGCQDGYQPVLWALVELSASLVARRILIFGTGYPIPDRGAVIEPAYVGTSVGTPFVWHVFDVGEVEA